MIFKEQRLLKKGIFTFLNLFFKPFYLRYSKEEKTNTFSLIPLLELVWKISKKSILAHKTIASFYEVETLLTKK